MHPASSMGWFMKLQHFLQDLKVLSSPNTVGVLFSFFSYNYCTPEVPEQMQGWVERVMHWCWQLAVLCWG